MTPPTADPAVSARPNGNWEDWTGSPQPTPARGLRRLVRGRREAGAGGGRGDSAIAVIFAVGLITVWEVLCDALKVPVWLLPPPSAIVAALVTNWALILQHSLVTLQEVLVGMILSVLLGVGFGVAIARSRAIERAVYPYVVASQAVPIIAIAPLLLIWLGYGIEPKVIVVALVCFFPIVVNLVDGLRSVDVDLVRLLRTMGASGRQILMLVEVPSALPYLLSGLKVAASVSVIGAIIGEWVGAQSGLGYLMIRSASQFQTARVFAIIVVLAAMGLGLFWLVGLVERRLLSYRITARAE
jgi:ABC-type nitrate/sulfonate/bicarbonate transport system permease component